MAKISKVVSYAKTIFYVITIITVKELSLTSIANPLFQKAMFVNGIHSLLYHWSHNLNWHNQSQCLFIVNSTNHKAIISSHRMNAWCFSGKFEDRNKMKILWYQWAATGLDIYQIKRTRLYNWANLKWLLATLVELVCSLNVHRERIVVIMVQRRAVDFIKW